MVWRKVRIQSAKRLPPDKGREDSLPRRHIIQVPWKNILDAKLLACAEPEAIIR